MAIELSNIMFTDQDDIVPSSGGGEIVNHGIANTLDGNDLITGTGSTLGFDNRGTINTGNDNDSLISSERFSNSGNIFLGEGNDSIITQTDSGFFPALYNYLGIIDTGNGNDTISGAGPNVISNLNGTINTGNGEDSIICHGKFLNPGNVFLGEGNDFISAYSGFSSNSAIDNYLGIIDTGNGNDTISGAGSYGISNMNGIINTGNGKDSIICPGEFFNSGNVFLGDGNDSIITDTDLPELTIRNFNFIGTGDGNDTITSSGIIYNQGVIETGDGDDSIIVDGGIEDITGTTYGIYNDGGAIITGNGNDSIIANRGFESAPNSSGAWFLGEGEDYIKGYGSGDFYGGNGNDILELTPGSYTVGRWGATVTFSKGSSLMLASEFEQLIAGGTTHLFASLTEGQTIVVA